MVKSASVSVRNQLISWRLFYLTVFGIKNNFSNLKIPGRVPGFDRLVVVANGLTPGKIITKMRECVKVRAGVWTVRDDDAITENSNIDRFTDVRPRPKNDYVVFVKNHLEADKELKNPSCEKIQSLRSINFNEQLLLSFKYLIETGKHLGSKYGNLCAGSRHVDGGIPKIVSHCDGLIIDWYGRDIFLKYPSDEALRYRRVIL